ncbi:MAG: PH domain-containing protein, partial [Varibaculum cambriense]|nr:PH domain-containing protein [Varibaculum cambriense]
MGDQYQALTNENSSGYSEDNTATAANRQHSLTVADAVSAPAGRAEESTWRRVHWLTPLLQVWQALVIIVVVVLTQSLNNVIMLIKNLRENVPGHPGILLLVIAVPLAMLALLIIYLYFAWRATSWKITATDVQYRRGIFFKKHRKIPLDRVQSVDVYRPLAARIFGLGALRVESAGGQGSRVEIQFLANKYLDRARREVVARIAGRSLTDETSHQTGAEGLVGTDLFAEDDYHLAADEYEVYRVSPGRLIASVLLTSEVVWLLIMSLIVV